MRSRRERATTRESGEAKVEEGLRGSRPVGMAPSLAGALTGGGKSGLVGGE
ncbi:MAG: hypothetical protein AAF591_02240 [Verrucomicrobiota bacterium]